MTKNLFGIFKTGLSELIDKERQGQMLLEFLQSKETSFLMISLSYLVKAIFYWVGDVRMAGWVMYRRIGDEMG